MTLNERLFAAGLIDQFYEALKEWDTGRLQEILATVGLPNYRIENLRRDGNI
jgi:hypothetical protein